MSGITLSALSAVQALGQGQRLDLVQTFNDGGFMMYPLGFFAIAGVLIIIWKFIDLQIKSARNRKLLGETDQLLAEHRIQEAMRVCQESKAPAAAILAAGLRRQQEGTERVMKAIENAGLIELAGLELQTGTILEEHGIRFFEERYGSIGPMRLDLRCYPRDLRPGDNTDRYDKWRNEAMQALIYG